MEHSSTPKKTILEEESSLNVCRGRIGLAWIAGVLTARPNFSVLADEIVLFNHHSHPEMNDSASDGPLLFTFDPSVFFPQLIVIVVEDSLSTWIELESAQPVGAANRENTVWARLAEAVAARGSKHRFSID